jgi:chromosome segregation ATPase
MSDLQRILSDLSDALPAIPEKLAALAAADEALRQEVDEVEAWADERGAELSAKLEELGQHFVALGDASSEEHAQYEALIDAIERVVEPVVFGTVNAATMGAGGEAFRVITHLELEQLKLLPVALQGTADALGSTMDELGGHVGELREGIDAAARSVSEHHHTVESSLERASQALTDASGGLADAVEEHHRQAGEAGHEVRDGLDELHAQVGSRLTALGETAAKHGEELDEHARSASSEVTSRLHEHISSLTDALHELHHEVLAHEASARANHGLFGSLFEALGRLGDPLRSGMESAKDAGREAGLPI